MASATASASPMEGSGARLLRALWLERPIGYPECPTNVKRRKRRLRSLTCSTALRGGWRRAAPGWSS